MLWIDEKYAKIISPRLKLFVDKGHHVYSFRCPLCGDSVTKSSKRRGFFHPVEGNLLYACHNCGVRLSFGSFLKTLDPNLFQQYNLEKFKEKMGVMHHDKPPIDFNLFKTKKYIPDIFKDLPLAKDVTGKVAEFCLARKLPVETFEFRYAESFISWASGNTDKFSAWKGVDHARLIIPWRDRSKHIIGYSARALDSSQEKKYFRIFVDDTAKERFFGLDRVDESKQIYVLEGEIDSLMIPNAIAVSNGKLHTYMNKDAVYIPDSDVRNPHIMKNVSDMIEKGLRVCMLPTDLPKDLNEMRQTGMTSDKILSVINNNTFKGLEAKLKFNSWKKT